MRHIIVILTILLIPLFAHAHELRPAVADIRFTEGLFEVEFRVTLEALVAEVDPTITDTTESMNAARYDALRAMSPSDLAAEFAEFEARFLEGIIAEFDFTTEPVIIRSVHIPEVGDTELIRDSTIIISGLVPAGANQMIFGWSKSFGALIVRVTTIEGAEGYTAYLQNGQLSDSISVEGVTPQSGVSVFADYIVIGFAHILPKGLDHILFVVGLFLLSAQLRPLLWQISAFTMAHTITLAMGMFGVVTVPAGIVEPLIAASIVYVAVENIVMSGLSPWRPFVVFGFGLLHGLGFASVLAEVGIVRSQFVTGLIGFNVGVEIGQLTVIAICFILVGFWFRNKTWYRRGVTIPLSVIVAVIGAFWLLERTVMAA